MTEHVTDHKKATYRKPKRTFENSGTVNPKISYFVTLNNVSNAQGQDIKTMVDLGRYFSIFAPRQSGKTTFLKNFCKELHDDQRYVAIILSFQKYKELDKETFYTRIEKSLYRQLSDRLEAVKCDKFGEIQSFLIGHRLKDHISFSDLFEELNRIIEYKKLVIFIDEFDGIPLSELENFLTTLRDLYQEYKDITQKALYSVGLVGIRNITKLIVGGVSPFNIADQVEMPSFSFDNVRELYSQYTGETGQPFTNEAIKRVYHETSGQPWLVNRLGTILTVNVKPGTAEALDEQDVEIALDILLRENNSHFDNLYEKAKLYKETFVEIVFDHVEYNPDDEDQGWLEQYGLIKDANGSAAVTTNIYKSRYIKTFFKEANAYQDVPLHTYTLPGDRLDMKRIILDFDHYIAQIGVKAFYSEEKPYEKTGQFLLTAWLYQFVRGGKGELRYEVLSGLGRMDILLTYKGKKYIVETKVNRQNLSSTIDRGVSQVASKYLSPEAVNEGYLVVFDTKTPVGEGPELVSHQQGNKTVMAFVIGIERT